MKMEIISILVVLLSHSVYCRCSGMNSTSLSLSLPRLYPNLYFIGVSKCGTTSVANILTQHPLVVGVGRGDAMAGESHLFDKCTAEETNARQTILLRNNLQKKNSEKILKNGILMHYTPHYMGSDSVINKIQASLKMSENPVKARYLVMLRNPVSRTSSSWWYKNHCYQKMEGPCLHYFESIAQGVVSAINLDKCHNANKISLNRMIEKMKAGESVKESTLDTCSLGILAAHTTSFYGAHIGKSLYVNQLMLWLNKISLDDIYLMIFENFIENPTREIELFLDWMGVKTYGEDGYSSKEALEILTKKQYNSHPIPEAVSSNQVRPLSKSLTTYFQLSIQQLQYLVTKNEKNLSIAEMSGNWSDYSADMLRFHLQQREERTKKGT